MSDSVLTRTALVDLMTMESERLPEAQDAEEEKAIVRRIFEHATQYLVMAAEDV